MRNLLIFGMFIFEPFGVRDMLVTTYYATVCIVLLLHNYVDLKNYNYDSM